MIKGFITLIFIILISVNIFLAFQLYENINVNKVKRQNDNEKIVQAANLTLESIRQSDYLKKLEGIIEANILFKHVYEDYGKNLDHMSTALKIPLKRLEDLKVDIERILQFNRSLFNEQIDRIVKTSEVEKNLQVLSKHRMDHEKVEGHGKKRDKKQRTAKW